ncbi:MAG: hypothetical protein A2X25_00385 [Chloroflexi bacterium GWB2_49_20]|nr:MAG: hypothetical protein A2X25_00385 [Chloroflexi bacterium GWB2_49_20]OGN80139.1 MAG: hypothetical protein A2X26_09240 [Chloroflexi bacterium GWC2_49_37]OGN83112.1 MAG: hypothetical protein A2X27_13000 [Chloroflexi bacterium GWD2_49_16]
MQPLSDPRLLVIALSGLPITLALLLSFEHQPVSEKHICSMLGISDKTAASALHRLKEFQIITRVTGGWTISEGYQLPVSAIREPVENLWIKNRKNSDFSSSSSVVVDSREPHFKAESTTTTTIKESENFRLLKRTCEIAGIHEPKSSKIARIPGMTVDMIKQHVDNALAEGLYIGAAIFRIENEWPVKTEPEPNDRHKYSTGKYAEFIVS